MARRVVDSSVVLALVLDELIEDISEQIRGAMLSTVNAAEIVHRLRRGGSSMDVGSIVDNLGLAVVPFDLQLAITAGELGTKTRVRGLSLGDRACLALALREDVPAMTADRVWGELNLGVKVELVR